MTADTVVAMVLGTIVPSISRRIRPVEALKMEGTEVKYLTFRTNDRLNSTCFARAITNDDLRRLFTTFHHTINSRHENTSPSLPISKLHLVHARDYKNTQEDL